MEAEWNCQFMGVMQSIHLTHVANGMIEKLMYPMFGKSKETASFMGIMQRIHLSEWLKDHVVKFLRKQRD